MVLIKSLVLAGLATLSFAKGPGAPPPTYDNSAVLDLIPSNFDSIVLSGKPALVEFFAPWCGHCKNLAPVYEQLAQDFSGAKDKISIAKVDADAEKSLGKRFGIQGFPTIKYFNGKDETPEDYNGGRDLESLTEFIKEKIGADQDAIVAFTAPWCGHCKTLAPIWEKVAQDFASEEGVLIAKVDAEADNAKATAKDQGVSSYPTIKFFPKGSTTPEAYDGGRTEADLVEFMNSKAGTHRAPGGGLNAVAGTIEALDTLVAKFTSGSSIAEVAGEVTKAAEELARLDGILKKGGLAPAKLDEFTSKTNILR